MTLIDTSVWIEHVRHPIPEVRALLDTERALAHPMVLAELCLGKFKLRNELLTNVSLLDSLPMCGHEEVLALVERFALAGRGIGWVDCHLLASAREAHCHLLTKDIALKAAWLQVRPKV
jgi:predicted nucleic acid-binding protein